MSFQKNFSIYLLDPTLKGDKVKLPHQVLDDIIKSLGGVLNLPTPLTFQLTFKKAQLYSSVIEFTSSVNTLLLSPFLYNSLIGNNNENEILTQEDHADSSATPLANQINLKLVTLPPCTYVKLSPLNIEYLQISDIRSTLESFLRQNFATLTEGEILTVEDMKLFGITEHRFLVQELKPEKGCLIIDVDINVDVATENIDLAENALKFRDFNSREILELHWMGTNNDTCAINDNCFKDKFVYYKVKIDNGKNYELVVRPKFESEDCDIFISFEDKPTLLDNYDYNVDKGTSKLSIVENSSSNSDYLFIGVRGYSISCTFSLQLQVSSKIENVDMTDDADTDANNSNLNDNVKCGNCLTFITKEKFHLHEAFCFRNNVKCKECLRIFKKTDFDLHWHCENCDKVGRIDEKEKHMNFLHAPIVCDCLSELPLKELNRHRKEDCPKKLIICRFCHLLVERGQKSLSGKDAYLGFSFSVHESECGSRTIDCIKCSRKVQLKDVNLHMTIHKNNEEFEKIKRQKVEYNICSNVNCTNEVSSKYPNILNCCPDCFRQFYSTSHDPNNQKLITRLVKRYHQQLTAGCGQAVCYNEYCLTSSASTQCSKSVSSTEAALQALELVKLSALFSNKSRKLYICVSPDIGNRHRLATSLSKELGYDFKWCIKALKATNDNIEHAGGWLLSNAFKAEK
ncbi:hypothetical protein HDU92_008983 [Lobulomyces angularis]|nr:hypothetical protein HDU92_008983 [Lobulomyces angularis]